MKPNTIQSKIIDYIIITIGASIVCCSVYFFMIPSHLSIASISGLSLVLSELLPFKMTTINLVLNLTCLLLGYVLIGKEFGGKTVYTSIFLPVGLIVLETLFPNYEPILDDQFQLMVCYIFLADFGCAILFNRNASSGGLDVIAKILNKYLHLDLGKALTICGLFVAISSFFAYDMKTVVLSVLGTYLNGIVLDHFIFGQNIKKKVCIVSDDIDAIRKYVIDHLKSGASICTLVGAYTLEAHDELDVIVDKSEYAKLMTYIKNNYPDAFVTVTVISEVQYQPKWIEK